jgi:Tfp pilus assembly protein PilZ
MAVARDFAEFELREVVAINTGTGADWSSVSAIVVAAGRDMMELALGREPDHPEAMAPGCVVRVRRDRASSVRAQVIAVDRGAIPVVVVRPLTAAQAAENQRSYHRAHTQMRETTGVGVIAGRPVSFRAWIVDLSGGGARMVTLRELHQGDAMTLRLHLPESTGPIDVSAEVAWVRPLRRFWQAGIRFVDVPDAARDRIIRAVFLSEVQMRRMV